ncbi:MAG: hypothetical protein Kow0092_37610 [Deferrisomatales bacterium]
MTRSALALVLLVLPSPAAAWDLSRHSIPVEEIRSGGPPRDGIPALLDPAFVPAEEAAFLRPDDRVLGFVHQGEARAYPIRILSWHELVNDRVGGAPVLVSW